MGEEVKITVLNLSAWSSETWSATKFLKIIADAVAGIPEEFRADATAVLETEGDSSSADLTISYMRPQTAEEAERDRQSSERYKAENAARERREYERLKAKYGS